MNTTLFRFGRRSVHCLTTALILLCTLLAQARAQLPDSLSYYPHSAGNIWQYNDYMCAPYGGSNQIYSHYDSSDAQGYQYRYYDDSIGGCRAPMFYIFQGDSIVWDADNSDFTSWKALYRFNVPDGSKWVYGHQPYMVRLVSTGWDCGFRCDSVKNFQLYIDVDSDTTTDDSLGLVLSDIGLKRGIGLMWSIDEPGVSRYLSGARIAGVTYGTVTSVLNEKASARNLSCFQLHQNYPNPFNPTTTISFDLDKGSQVTLEIYNIAGQRIRRLMDRYMLTGTQTVAWDGKNSVGRNVSSGVYLYRLTVDGISMSRKMVLVR